MPSPAATTTDSRSAPRISASELAERFPEAVAFARAMRDVFGPDTKLLYAMNRAGDEIGKPSF